MKLSLAVFFTFASVGLITDLFHPQKDPFYSVLAWCAYNGLTAAAFLLVVMRQPKRTIILMLAVAGSTVLLIRVLPSHPAGARLAPELERRLILDAVFILVAIYAGYMLFLVFIETEGFRHLRAQTELELAERLQTTLVPPLSLQTAGVHIEARSMPSSKMGGDLADALVWGDSVTCYVADVSGHGIAAGVLMGTVKAVVRMALLRGDALDGVLGALQGVLPGLKDPSSYVTMAGLRFTHPTMAEYSTAGHVPILHYRDASHAIDRLAIEQFPVGLIAGVNYRAANTDCGPDDVFLVMTDGIIEVADTRDAEFGMERVEGLLLENACRPLPEIAEIIMGAVAKYGKQMDDQTILLARIRR